MMDGHGLIIYTTSKYSEVLEICKHLSARHDNTIETINEQQNLIKVGQLLCKHLSACDINTTKTINEHTKFCWKYTIFMPCFE